MFKAPRGTRDILPAEQGYWKWITGRAAEICRLYGYQRIDTPVFEDAGLFRHSVGDDTDIVEKQMYSFDDRGGDRITLRPEGTAPVCRAYIEHGLHNLPQPVRLFYFGPIFRYERPQAGRHRQHQQFGCEAIGAADAALDAEIIDLAWSLYASLGLGDLTLQLNSIGCRTCRREYLRRLRDYYSGHESPLCRDCQARLARNPLRLLDCKNPACHDLVAGAPRITGYLCTDCQQHFAGLREGLAALGIPYELNPHLVRGLDYYTRTVFEIQPIDAGGQSTIGAGGRYDDLIEVLGGRPAPAVGFATGLERTPARVGGEGLRGPPGARSQRGGHRGRGPAAPRRYCGHTGHGRPEPEGPAEAGQRPGLLPRGGDRGGGAGQRLLVAAGHGQGRAGPGSPGRGHRQAAGLAALRPRAGATSTGAGVRALRFRRGPSFWPLQTVCGLKSIPVCDIMLADVRMRCTRRILSAQERSHRSPDRRRDYPSPPILRWSGAFLRGTLASPPWS